MKLTKKILIVGLFWLSLGKVFAAVTWKETTDIYKKLIITNHLKFAPLTLMKDSDINGYTTNTGIVITSGDLRKLSPPEMALVLGHELTHWQYGDVYHNMGGKYQEDRADYYGADYATNIGYNRCEMSNLFLKLYLAYGNNGGRQDPHSASLLRFYRLHRGCP